MGNANLLPPSGPATCLCGSNDLDIFCSALCQSACSGPCPPGFPIEIVGPDASTTTTTSADASTTTTTTSPDASGSWTSAAVSIPVLLVQAGFILLSWQ